MRTQAALLLALVVAACGGSSSGGSGSGSGGGGGGGGAAPSQQVVWPLSDQVSVLGNNLQIDVENMYGYPVSGLTPISDVEALASGVNDALGSLSTSACASDPKAADAALASKALVDFIQSLPAGGGPSSMLDAQDTKRQQLTAALRKALTDSPCINQLTPPTGSANVAVGTDLSAVVAISGNPGSVAQAGLSIPLSGAQALPAIAIVNKSDLALVVASLEVAYADGTSRTIKFGSAPGDGTSTVSALSAQLAAGASLVVDVDTRAIKNVTLVGASLSCPAPPGGNGSGAPPCNGSVKIAGLSAGNGLLP